MSEPRVGDVWIVDGEAHVCYDVPNQNEVVVGTATRWTSTTPRARKCVWPRDELGPAEFNLFDLLSGDPAAWRAALRFAPFWKHGADAVRAGATGLDEAAETFDWHGDYAGGDKVLRSIRDLLDAAPGSEKSDDAS